MVVAILILNTSLHFSIKVLSAVLSSIDTTIHIISNHIRLLYLYKLMNFGKLIELI